MATAFLAASPHPASLQTRPCIIRTQSPRLALRRDDRARFCRPVSIPQARLSQLDSKIASLAIPALGALALDPLLSIIDTAFIGRLGVPPIAGLGVASIALNMSFAIFNFLAMATTPLIATAASSERGSSSTSRVLVSGIYTSVFLGLFSGSMLYTHASTVCNLFRASPSALPHAVAYLRVRSLVAPFALVAYVFNGAFRGLQDTRIPFLVGLVVNSINLLLDPLLIFGLKLGIAGAAIATAVSQVLAVTLMAFILVKRGHLQVWDILKPPRASEVFPLLKAGAMLTVRTTSLLATIAYATRSAATYGVASLAAYELCRQLWIFHAMILDSLAAAAQSLVASALARNSKVAARYAANRVVNLGALFGLALAAMAWAAGPSLPALFTDNEQVITLAAKCIRVAALCAPLNGAVFALDGVLSASKDYSYLAFAIALAAVLAIIALRYIKHSALGVVAVWLGLNVLMVGRALTLFTRFSTKYCPVPPVRFALAQSDTTDNENVATDRAVQ